MKRVPSNLPPRPATAARHRAAASAAGSKKTLDFFNTFFIGFKNLGFPLVSKKTDFPRDCNPQPSKLPPPGGGSATPNPAKCQVDPLRIHRIHSESTQIHSESIESTQNPQNPFRIHRIHSESTESTQNPLRIHRIHSESIQIHSDPFRIHTIHSESIQNPLRIHSESNQNSLSDSLFHC